MTKSLPAVLSIGLLCHVATAQVNVLTANGGNDRTNANLLETQLRPGNITSDAFGKLGAFPVDGQVYGQPLYASGVTVPGRGKLNLLFITTMHNSIYAYDADSLAVPSLVWRVNVGSSVPS